MMKTSERLTLNISLEQTHGEKQTADHIYGFFFPYNGWKKRYGKVHKQDQMIFYIKDMNGNVLHTWNITDIWRNDYFVIHPRFEKNVPEDMKESLERISIKFI
ncbi:hypothetical protein [Sinobaca qinghaiensis]|nr:hypothetical protein [Sinobaca qinghaiensis]